MYVIKKPTKNPEHTRVLIVESVRENGKVKQKIVSNIGVARNPTQLANFLKVAHASLEYEIEKKHKCELLFKYGDNLDELEKINPSIFEFRPKSFKEIKRVHEGVETVFSKLYDKMGYSNLIENPKYNEILKQLVISRVMNPTSKLKTQENLERDSDKSFSIDSIYRTMDKLSEKEDKLLEINFKFTQSIFQEKIDVVFFDVTTLYFESVEQDELKDFGFSKDCKFNQVQVVLALATTSEGIPVGYKLFKGNTAETKTLILCLDEWKKSIDIQKVIFIADRAMFTKENIYEIERRGYSYIISAKIRTMDNFTKNKILNEECYKIREINGEITWEKTFEHKLEHKFKVDKKTLKHDLNGRLICTYSSKRARKDIKDRERILDKIQKFLNKNPDAKTDAKKAITNMSLKKYCNFNGKAYVSLEEEKIIQDEKWDGMYGIFTNYDGDSAEIISRYRQLYQIEETFRITKHDLKVRPIYHYKPSRIRAHIAICYLALCLIRHMQYQFKKANLTYSSQRIKEELNRVQYSICKDYSTNILFKVPSALSPIAQKIYSALGIERKQILSVIK
jgi:transposase